MRKYRHFDEEFKRDLIARIDSGVITKSHAAREHNLSSSLVDRWQKQIHEGSLRSRPSAREKQLERELDLYKKKVGELSVQVDKKLKEASASTRRLNGYIVTGNPSARSGKASK
jgi:transposase-like protein